jgi:hypothetical protein
MAIKLKITHGNYSAEGTSATVKCNGKKLASDIVIEAVEGEEAPKIGTFTHNYSNNSAQQTFEFVVGMTWAEWAQSEYGSTSEILIQSSGDVYWYSGGSATPLYNGTVACVSTDKIAENGVYTSRFVADGGGGSN